MLASEQFGSELFVPLSGKGPLYEGNHCPAAAAGMLLRGAIRQGLYEGLGPLPCPGFCAGPPAGSTRGGVRHGAPPAIWHFQVHLVRAAEQPAEKGLCGDGPRPRRRAEKAAGAHPQGAQGGAPSCTPPWKGRWPPSAGTSPQGNWSGCGPPSARCRRISTKQVKEKRL